MLSSLKKLTHLINLLANADIFQPAIEDEKGRRILDYLGQMPSLTFLNTIVPNEGSRFIRILWGSGLSKLAPSQADVSCPKASSKALAYEIVSGASLASHKLEYNKWGNFFWPGWVGKMSSRAPKQKWQWALVCFLLVPCSLQGY